ncbi:TonB-dependent receptor plug domain-containing protein [Spirosoma sordidisoli]|uniref:TonB-dependent receptor n=1 Tax=Spirosoma sordidisoli TaxID=2502893 RepID=A0A4Q2UD95_9BACT|nr:TonB-dependent receptor [Spirosoma sordidisoli]RYC67143.1 TonB-dependent receptor [Spirosoma sordidisoli]
MRNPLLRCLLISAPFFCQAQAIIVRDQADSLPLEGVTLSSTDRKMSAVTDAAGRVDLADFKGASTIEIRTLGYPTLRLSYDELAKRGPSLYLQASPVSLQQVVVTANRWRQSSREVPSRIIRISARDVAFQNPQTAADMLGISGEVFIQKSQQGGGSPMIRGFSTNRLLITVDGVRMNTAIFRSGNLQNVISLDPYAIANTEVLFGPGSVMYGSDAIGGVMSFYTLTPQLGAGTTPAVSGGAALRYSSANNEQTGHADVSLGWKKWALLSSVSHNTYGDLRMGSHGPADYLRPEYVDRINGEDRVVLNSDPRVQRPTGYSQINLMQKIRFRPTDRWDINYGFHYSTTSDYARYDRLLRYRRGLPRSADWKYGPQTWMMNNLTVSQTSANTLYDQLTVRLAHQYFEESRIDRDLNDAQQRTTREQVQALSANLDFDKRITDRQRVFYGLEAVYNDVVSTASTLNIKANSTVAGAPRYPASNWASYAAYLTYQLKLNDRITLQSGLRYNQFKLNSQFKTDFYPFPFTSARLNNGALTGSLGLVYLPSDTWTLSTNLSTGFRSPNVDDIGKVFDSAPGVVVIPNPSLSAEYAYNAEVGAAKLIGNLLKVDVTGYYTLLDNALVRRNFRLNGRDSIVYNGELSQVQAIQNAAKARVYGLQAGLEFSLPAGLRLSSQFTYQKGDEELDDGTTSPLRHAAPWFGITRLSYTTRKLRLEVYAVYNDAVTNAELPQEELGKDYMYALDAMGKPYTPAWYTLNLKGQYSLNRYLTVNAGLENITDQRYRPYSSGISAAGRNLIISLRGRF